MANKRAGIFSNTVEQERIRRVPEYHFLDKTYIKKTFKNSIVLSSTLPLHGMLKLLVIHIFVDNSFKIVFSCIGRNVASLYLFEYKLTPL